MLQDNRVARELAAGRLWRAKEILQGRLRSAGYDTELYERYGKLLLQLGDHCEAGKYLFLSGSHESAYEDSIGTYLHRHGKTMRTLRATFPDGVRRTDATCYPERVQAALLAAGFSMPNMKHAAPKELSTHSQGWSFSIGMAFAILLLLLSAGFVVQGLRGLGWLLDRFSGS